MAKYDVYDLGNYFTYYSDVGLYDLMPLENRLTRLIKSIQNYSTVKVQNRLLDQISYSNYGTEKLWWVIAIYNDIINPLDMGNLQYLKIPNMQSINQILVYEKEKKLTNS